MELTLTEIKSIIKYIIENNRTLQEKGEYPVSVNIQSEAGIGKSQSIRDLAKKIGYTFVQINTSNMTSPDELIGYPQREYYVCKDDECKWITSDLIDIFLKAGWDVTEETRMGYAIPAWLKELDPNGNNILLLDDWTRSTGPVIQALYEVIYRQEYISWKLPINTTIILTSNPDSGSYLVASIDEAAATRMITFDIKFDKASWANWAEEKGIDGKAINFMLYYGDELMDRSKTKEAKINARSFTMFANIISGIKDWSKPENLALILQIASGCFLDKDDIVGGLFTTFIANKLDKLLSPEDLVTKDWSYVKGVLENQLYDEDKYRADIASIITTRFINYSMIYFSKSGAKTDLITDRIINLIENDKLLLSEDLIFSLVKTLNKKYPGRCNKLLLNPKLAKKLI